MLLLMDGDGDRDGDMLFMDGDGGEDGFMFMFMEAPPRPIRMRWVAAV